VDLLSHENAPKRFSSVIALQLAAFLLSVGEFTSLMKESVSIARALRWTGIVVFVASFLTPQIEYAQEGLVVTFKDSGLGAFIMTPLFLVMSLAKLSGIGDSLCALLLAVAWLNNFSVFVRLPPVIAWIPVSIPWLLLIFPALNWIHLGPLWTYVPFYPWAIGIGLIHGSAYFEPREVFDRWISDC